MAAFRRSGLVDASGQPLEGVSEQCPPDVMAPATEKSSLSQAEFGMDGYELSTDNTSGKINYRAVPEGSTR